MKNLLNSTLLIIFLASFNGLAKKPSTKLIDKIVGVINEQSITLSEVKRIQKTLKGRRDIAGVLYNKLKTQKDIINFLFQMFVVKKELDALGMSVSESRVDAQIENTLKRVRLTKAQLIRQLTKNGLTFEEYYQVIKQSMEFSLFQQRIIAPLVAISEQEIKSLYLQKAGDKAAQTVQYKLKDYLVDASKVSLEKANQLQEQIQSALKQGKTLKLKNIEMIDLGDIKSSSLSSQIRKHITSVEQGNVSKPLKLGGNYHLFYIEKKDIAQSDAFEKVKPQIANYLFERKSINISKSYFERKVQEDYDIKYL